MQLFTCSARLTDDETTLCDAQVTPQLLFCAQHHEEYCALKEREIGAAQEAAALKETVESLVADSADTYTTVREVQTARTVVELYERALRRRMDAGSSLRIRFTSSEC